jgi:hypothetical protein
MARYARGVPAALVVAAVLVSFAASADAAKPLTWSRKRHLSGCEPPHVFYSSQHLPGAKPCCATIEGMCGGGTACPGSGVCPDGTACVAGPVVDRPNIILFVSDDQGACHYGNASECRSTQSGSPLPAPRTPNLDVLAAYGTVFPVAHNTSAWCYPSLASILTGRYQKTFNGQRKVNDAYYTMFPSALRGLVTEPGTVADPYNAGNAIGGYCTILSGKFVGALDEGSFDAVARTGRKLGRNDCVPGAPGEAPSCGADAVTPYSPFTASRASDIFNFLDMLVYRLPGGGPPQYAMQHFFVWYGPRLPHAPLRAPQPVHDYLFGGFGSSALGGVMNLGQWCTGDSCAPVVAAFDESEIGTDRDFYANVWWTDDNIRELRRFLAASTAPHCIGIDGRSRFNLTTQGTCEGSGGTWTGVTPDLERNTIFIYLSDNGWHLPNSKHQLTENGYRTQLLVYDPRTLPTLPSWDPDLVPALPPQISPALAHTNDALPTALGFALGTSGSQACPVGPDGVACDGKDLGGHLATTPGGPAAPEALRHAMCGHQTKRPASPTRNRFMLTRPGSVGRCTRSTNPACTTSAGCGVNEFCVGGFCAPNTGSTSCTSNPQCGAGAVCLGQVCRMAPACIDDSDCTALVGADYVCAGKAETWCRNDPNVACSSNDDCPVCPTIGSSPVPCSRLCEARSLKLYVSPGASAQVQLTDQFLDPNEQKLHSGDGAALVTQMSSISGPYAGAIRRMNCCIDDWWPEIVAESGTTCTAGFSCPADLVCE